MFEFPQIDPIAFSLGPLAIRWYALAYMAGLLLGWIVLKRQITKDAGPTSSVQLDQLLNYCLIGILLGGRLGYVFFYKAGYYLAHPVEIVMIWQGGMSFHGGFLGICCAVWIFARKHKLAFLGVGDAIAMVAPIGLFFGRIANFINAELYGRVTDSPLGIIFPHAGPLPRHPSQLYEAVLEGLVLFIILYFCYHRKMRKPVAKRPDGQIIALFLLLYGCARYLVEFAREPDVHLGYLIQNSFFTLSMGQLLSLPMIGVGIALWTGLHRKYRHG